MITEGILTNDGGVIGGAGGAAIGISCGAAMGNSCAVGLRRGERRRAGVGGTSLRPGVLFRVVRLWVLGVVLTTLGAVGLLDKAGSTLGGGALSLPTLGDCLFVLAYISFMSLIACCCRERDAVVPSLLRCISIINSAAVRVAASKGVSVGISQ